MNKFIFPLLFSFHALALQDVIRIEPAYDEYEGLELVEILIRDGQYQNAENLLKAENDVDLRTQVLWAKLFNSKGQPAAALSQLKSVVPLQNEVQAERLMAYYQLGNFKACAELVFPQPGLISVPLSKISLDCMIKTQKFEKAFQLLKNRNEIELLDAKFQLFVRLGLFQQAFEFAQLNVTSGTYLDIFLNWSESLPKVQRQIFLQSLRLRFPNLSRAQGAWAQNEYSVGRMYSAAEGFRTTSHLDHSYSHLAAEVARSLRQVVQAQYLGSRIIDPSAQLKFKLALAIDRGRYSEIAGLAGPFLRSDLKTDQDLHYAMLFSFIKQGSESKAQYHRASITRDDLVLKVEKLLK